MGQPTKLDAIAVLRDYERAYFAANGWEAEIRRKFEGDYVIEGTRKHAPNVLPDDISTYTLEQLPGMARNLWSKVEKNNRHNFAELMHRLKPTRVADVVRLAPVNIREVIANEFQTSERG